MTDQQHLAVPPHSIEAEQGVIGALLRFNDGFDRIGDLQAKHFYREDHRRIFAEIVSLVSQGQAADVMTVLAAMQARGATLDGDLGSYLNQVAQSTPGASLVGQHANIVVDRALLRAVIQVSDQMAVLAHKPNGNTGDQVLDHARSLITALAERRVRNEPRMVKDIVLEFIEGAVRRAEGHESAISTGIEDLDRILNGGLRRQQLIIVAGRPSMGKTALSSDIGLNIAAGHSVMMFSMEMAGQELAGRSLANRGAASLSKVMGKIGEGETEVWDAISRGCVRLAQLQSRLTTRRPSRCSSCA